MYRIKKK